METKLKVVLGAIGSVVTLCIGCSCVGIFNSAGSDRPATPKQVTPTQSFLPLVDTNTVSAVPTDSPSPSDIPIIIPTTKAAPPPPPQKTEDEEDEIETGVTPGAFCSHAGALGRGKNGSLYTCKKSSTDDRLRWRR